MAWDSVIPIMVRSAIGDFDDPPKYSDDALAPVILTATQSVIFHVIPRYTYEIDMESLFLDPDPTDLDVNDKGFIHLVTLKSSAMILRAEVRRYGQQAIAIRDGTSAIDLKRDLRALNNLAIQYDREYNSAIFMYNQNNAEFGGKAIVSPYKTLLSNLEGYFPCSRVSRY